MHIESIAEQSAVLAQSALAALQRRYPHKLDHLMLGADDRPLPSDIHPVFDGSYDWHSSVHMHWSLLRLCRVDPSLWSRLPIEEHFEARFTSERVARETAYVSDPGRRSFERPYGWAWLLRLQSELDELSSQLDAPRSMVSWAQALRPLTDLLALRMAEFMLDSRYPVRSGTHANSAFALKLALDHSNAEGNYPLRSGMTQAAHRWFGGDANYPASYEPGGMDFLSPGLCEALLMRDVLGAEFPAWWDQFKPGRDGLSRWLEPVAVSDRTDAQIVHLDGLNLSRAWCLRALASSDPMHEEEFETAAQRHWNASWNQVTSGDFVATHWLLSFALLAVGEPLRSPSPNIIVIRLPAGNGREAQASSSPLPATLRASG